MRSVAFPAAELPKGEPPEPGPPIVNVTDGASKPVVSILREDQSEGLLQENNPRKPYEPPLPDKE